MRWVDFVPDTSIYAPVRVCLSFLSACPGRFASGPILKFLIICAAPSFANFGIENHQQLYDSSAPLNPKFAVELAAQYARTSGWGALVNVERRRGKTTSNRTQRLGDAAQGADAGPPAAMLAAPRSTRGGSSVNNDESARKWLGNRQRGLNSRFST